MEKVLYEDTKNGKDIIIEQRDDEIYIFLWNELAVISVEDFKNIVKEIEINE